MITSIILLNWNTLSYLKECVRSIKKYTKDYELIIVDNGSKENGTEGYILKVADKYIFNEINLGFSKGNNQGASIASGEFLVFMNSDIVVGKNWLEDMKETFEISKNCGAVGVLGNPREGIINGAWLGFQQYKGQYSTDTPVSNVMAFCMLMKRDVFNQIKFKEIFDKGCYEDNLLCKELIEKGYSIWISAEADVTHAKPGRSFEANNINYLELMQKNERIFDEQTK